MKKVQFRMLEPQERFQLDNQWWIKQDYTSAKHSNFEAKIDVAPSCLVLVRGEEPSNETTYKDKSFDHRGIRKRDWLTALSELFDRL